jgi:predicted dithiol-disulfide oxidoreductase (DUF899 family)
LRQSQTEQPFNWFLRDGLVRKEASLRLRLERDYAWVAEVAVFIRPVIGSRAAFRRTREPAMKNEGLIPAHTLAAQRHPLFPGESAEYRAARQNLLEEEIKFRRQMTRLTEQRRGLPAGPIIAKDYRFIDANGAETGLMDLFGAGSCLVTYFWMYGPQRLRPCPMCTNWLGAVNGNARDIMQRTALKILGRSPVERQLAFAQERGWKDLDFVQTAGDDYARDLALLNRDGSENPALVVFTKDGNAVRLFWAAEMKREMADPGQDPRDAPDIASLWSVLDLTPEGRGTDWYPKLSY